MYAYNDDMNETSSAYEPCYTPLLLRNLKLKNTKRFIFRHLNINSFVGKFDHLKVVNSQLLLDLTEIDLVVGFLFMLVRAYLVSN